MLRCEPNDYCVIVAGQPENIGAFVTVTEYSATSAPAGWVFEGASRDLVGGSGARMRQSFAPDGAFYVIDDNDLRPIRGIGQGQVAEAVIGVSSRG